MKTNEEIRREAEQMIALGRQYREEYRSSTVGAGIVPMPRVLVRLPESQITTWHDGDPEADARHTHRRERHIEAAIERDELVYRLIEREQEFGGSGRLVRDDGPSVVMFSRSGFDLLHTGYELAEEDRLAELLAPYVDRDEHVGEPADERTVAEVEGILEARLLPSADRLRTKAEIVDFLEGRLEPSVFIAHAIDRQCARECRREVRAQRQELKLTIDGS